MVKFKLGESVRIKSGQIDIYGRLLNVGDLVCKVKDVNVHGLTGKVFYDVEFDSDALKLRVKVEEDALEKVPSVKGISEEQAERLNDMMRKLRENVRMHVICSDMPDPNSWLRSFIDQKPEFKPFDVKTEFADVLKKWDERLPLHHLDPNIGSTYGRIPKLDFKLIGKFKMNEETLKKIREEFLKLNIPVVEGLEPASAESKMQKSRCIKLLESYRAEREKIAKGRKFERCLRENVVNEALERAIELLKGGSE